MNRNRDLAVAALLAVALHAALFRLLDLWPAPGPGKAAAEESRTDSREVEILIPEQPAAVLEVGAQGERPETEARMARPAPGMPEWTPPPDLREPPVYAAEPKIAAVRVSAGDARFPAEVVAMPGGPASSARGKDGAADRPARLKKISRPPYPFAARRRGEEGRVTLLVQVNAAGSAGGVRVARSSGSRDLDEAASLSVRKAVFQPAIQAGRAMESECEVTFEFRLEEETRSAWQEKTPGEWEE